MENKYNVSALILDDEMFSTCQDDDGNTITNYESVKVFSHCNCQACLLILLLHKSQKKMSF